MDCKLWVHLHTSSLIKMGLTICWTSIKTEKNWNPVSQLFHPNWPRNSFKSIVNFLHISYSSLPSSSMKLRKYKKKNWMEEIRRYKCQSDPTLKNNFIIRMKHIWIKRQKTWRSRLVKFDESPITKQVRVDEDGFTWKLVWINSILSVLYTMLVSKSSWLNELLWWSLKTSKTTLILVIYRTLS